MVKLEPCSTTELVVTTATHRAFATFQDEVRLFEWLRGRDPKIEYRIFERTTTVVEVDLSKLGQADTG